MSDLIERLDSFIEYAEATKKFADVGFYNELKLELEAHKEVVEAAKEFCKTLHINKNEPPVPVAGKMKALLESVEKLNKDNQ